MTDLDGRRVKQPVAEYSARPPGGVCVMKTKTSIKTAVSALFLLAVAAFAPACDIFNPNPCDPQEEVCPVSNHPSTLNPG
jgi:hypothetical protein